MKQYHRGKNISIANNKNTHMRWPTGGNGAHFGQNIRHQVHKQNVVQDLTIFFFSVVYILNGYDKKKG